MFVETTIARNPALIEWAFHAHKSRLIPPNTYIVDLDAVRQNATAINQAARSANMTVYMMTKQFGRNPVLCRTLSEDAGINKAVAVSMEEALILHAHGVRIGHLGHLVQIPYYYADKALSLEPDVITVFDLENAKKISNAALRIGVRQDILIRVTDVGDFIHHQQEGGVPIGQLPDTIESIKTLSGVKISGFVTFPSVVADTNKAVMIPTHNLKTLQKAIAIGRDLGIDIRQVNAAGGNSTDTLGLLSPYGVTHIEPGHAFTGTTYQASFDAQCKEKPALVYLTEVSHNLEGSSYVFGGGFYGRSQVKHAIVSAQGGLRTVNAYGSQPGSIDYYARMSARLAVGTGVVYAFRAQLFILNSLLAVVDGLSNGCPELLGVYNREGISIN